VLVSNRGVASDSVAVVHFDSGNGALELASLQSTYGREPRELVFAAGGSRVIVANQDDDSIIVFAFDETSGTHEQLSVNPVPTPVCVQVV
jgi:6-phosphogluconolactonase (cycloisomerase 2 family)